MVVSSTFLTMISGKKMHDVCLLHFTNDGKSESPVFHRHSPNPHNLKQHVASI